MRGFGCPHAAPGSRRAHDFQPFAADMAGESRTLAVIFCRLCGEMRQVEVTLEQAPLDDAVRTAIGANHAR
jgi:hypothetical protein